MTTHDDLSELLNHVPPARRGVREFLLQEPVEFPYASRYICMFIRVYMFTCICTFRYLYICMYTYPVHMYIYVHMYRHTHTQMYTYTQIYISTNSHKPYS